MRYPGIPHPGGERSAMKRIDILPSKSAAHRMLIAAALCEEPCDVILSERSLDIEATENCLAEIRRVAKGGRRRKEIAKRQRKHSCTAVRAGPPSAF